MIQANELRLNNKVLCDGKVCTVKGINYFIDADANKEGYIFDLYIGEKLVQTPYEQDINPIQLTPEILEKCEWFKSTINPKFQSFRKMTAFVVEGKVINQMGLEVEYLHQLQNLYFVLTNEELPVNL